MSSSTILYVRFVRTWRLSRSTTVARLDDSEQQCQLRVRRAPMESQHFSADISFYLHLNKFELCIVFGVSTSRAMSQ